LRLFTFLPWWGRTLFPLFAFLAWWLLFLYNGLFLLWLLFFSRVWIIGFIKRFILRCITSGSRKSPFMRIRLQETVIWVAWSRRVIISTWWLIIQILTTKSMHLTATWSLSTLVTFPSHISSTCLNVGTYSTDYST